MNFNKLKKCLLTMAAAAVLVLPAVITPAGASEVVYGNAKEDQPDLFVHKRVVTAVEGYEIPDDSFTFTLMLDGKPAKNREYTLLDSGGNVVENKSGQNTIPWKTTSTGVFTLKNGQTARFEYVGNGVSYEVREDTKESYQVLVPSDGAVSGTVGSEGAMANFENQYVPFNPSGPPDDENPPTTTMTVTKAIRYPYNFKIPQATLEADFRFRITVKGMPFEDELYALSDAEGDIPGEYETDDNGEFTLKAGQVATFYDVPADGDYKVEELTDNMPEGWYQTAASQTEGPITQPLVSARFTNTNASFLVSKMLRGEDSVEETDEERLNQDFTFELKDENGQPWKGAKYYLYTTGGDPLTDTFGNQLAVQETDDNGEFKLKGYQSALFINIPAGTKYSVSEKETEHYVQTLPTEKEGYVDKVVKTSVETLPFENHYTESMMQLVLWKTDSGKTKSLEGAEFSLFSDEKCTVHAALGENENPIFTTDENGRLTIENLPDGRYFLKEMKAPFGYGRIREPIEIILDRTSGYTVIENEYAELGIKDEEAPDNNTMQMTVANKRIIIMPDTGIPYPAMATIIIAVIAAGGVLFISFRKRKGGTKPL